MNDDEGGSGWFYFEAVGLALLIAIACITGLANVVAVLSKSL